VTPAPQQRRPRTPAGRARRTHERLALEYPGTAVDLCELDHGNPYELLVATILSAQCTDARVNMVTPGLFARYPTPEDLAAADPEELEEIIRSTGFFKSKARNLMGMATAVTERFGGEVPGAMADLVSLPGVGRKTANVVLNMWWGHPAQAVDTHVFRVGNRTGIAPGRDPDAVERAIEDNVPAPYLRHAHHWLILHGRYVCRARKPACPACLIRDLCLYEEKTL
jgi:endonuclease III